MINPPDKDKGKNDLWRWSQELHDFLFAVPPVEEEPGVVVPAPWSDHYQAPEQAIGTIEPFRGNLVRIKAEQGWDVVKDTEEDIMRWFVQRGIPMKKIDPTGDLVPEGQAEVESEHETVNSQSPDPRP